MTPHEAELIADRLAAKTALLRLWCEYVEREKLILHKAQWDIAENLIDLIVADPAVGKFFVARMTGVSFIFNHFEKFCRTPKPLTQ